MEHGTVHKRKPSSEIFGWPEKHALPICRIRRKGTAMFKRGFVCDVTLRLCSNGIHWLIHHIKEEIKFHRSKFMRKKTCDFVSWGTTKTIILQSRPIRTKTDVHKATGQYEFSANNYKRHFTMSSKRCNLNVRTTYKVYTQIKSNRRLINSANNVVLDSHK